jgi:hypothetical protein
MARPTALLLDEAGAVREVAIAVPALRALLRQQLYIS